MSNAKYAAAYRSRQAEKMRRYEEALRWIVEREKISTSAAAYEMAHAAYTALYPETK